MDDDSDPIRLPRKYALYPPKQRATSDQIPINVQTKKGTFAMKGNKSVWIAKPSAIDLEKRQFTLQLTLFAEEPGDMPRVNPCLCFVAQPQGYDKNDEDWEGDVSIAPYLNAEERNEYDPRVTVIFGVKGWMGRNQSKFHVQEVLNCLEEKDQIMLPGIMQSLAFVCLSC